MAVKVRWIPVASDVLTGAIGGALSAVVAKSDEDRDKARLAAGKPKLKFFNTYGNYVDYGLPLAALAVSLFGVIPADWEDRLLVMGSVLAGRRATYAAQHRQPKTTPTPWNPAPSSPPTQPPAFSRPTVGWQPTAVRPS